jgi:hypothetical protein
MPLSYEQLNYAAVRAGGERVDCWRLQKRTLQGGCWFSHRMTSQEMHQGCSSCCALQEGKDADDKGSSKGHICMYVYLGRSK